MATKIRENTPPTYSWSDRKKPDADRLDEAALSYLKRCYCGPCDRIPNCAISSQFGVPFKVGLRSLKRLQRSGHLREEGEYYYLTPEKPRPARHVLGARPWEPAS